MSKLLAHFGDEVNDMVPNPAAVNGEECASELYLDLCFNLCYMMRADPERSAEFDPGWARQGLEVDGRNVSDCTDEELLEVFDDAADVYEQYEHQRLAEAIILNSQMRDRFDLSWVRRVLGYRSPDPGPDDSFAVQVWHDMWDRAAKAVVLHQDAQREIAEASSSSESAAEVAPAAAAVWIGRSVVLHGGSPGHLPCVDHFSAP